LFSKGKNKNIYKQTKMQTIIEELSAPVIQMLAEQHARKILDYHLGKYELEEGETVDAEWSLEDMQLVAKRIVIGGNATQEPIVSTYDEIYEE
jgi:hypothetical protein